MGRQEIRDWKSGWGSDQGDFPLSGQGAEAHPVKSEWLFELRILSKAAT